jgi:hypothetical protein
LKILRKKITGRKNDPFSDALFNPSNPKDNSKINDQDTD